MWLSAVDVAVFLLLKVFENIHSAKSSVEASELKEMSSSHSDMKKPVLCQK